jgi:hypothetical protein
MFKPDFSACGHPPLPFEVAPFMARLEEGAGERIDRLFGKYRRSELIRYAVMKVLKEKERMRTRREGQAGS